MNEAIQEILAKLSDVQMDLRNLARKNEDALFLQYISRHSEQWLRLVTRTDSEFVDELIPALQKKIDDSEAEDYLFRLFLYSFMLHVSADGQYAERICKMVYDAPFTKDNRLFVFNQLKRYYLTHAGVKGTPALQQLYDDVVTEWKDINKETLKPLPSQNRLKNKIVVITLQFLGSGHAPTKTAMERIFTIGKLLGKEVICINSREQYTLKGVLPWYDIIGRSVIQDYNGVHIMSHNDYDFPIIQPEVEMPDEEMVTMLLEEIRNMAPWMAVVCGDRCLLGDLCAEMIPTICIPMTFSTIPKKVHEFVAVGRTIPDTEKEQLAKDGYDLESIIESVFTFEVIKQTSTLTREGLGLPEDKFLIGIIGIRLDSEVREDFLRLLLGCLDAGIHLVFAGKFDRYAQLCETIEGLKEHSTFVGFQKDILALWDLLDLYINPPRVGGGFSVAEAFCKGKPGISMNWGDVAASAGPEFCVESLDEYPALIRRYISDQDFYQEMSEKAVARSRRLFDSKGEMEKILQTAETRKLWF